jgi:peptide/nickel transport system permease protein
MRHLLRRIGFYAVALWLSVTINFFIPRLAPGDPASILIARSEGKINPEAMHALEIGFGISHDPLWIQYFQYLNQLLHGNLGVSITYSFQSVAATIGGFLPWTLALFGFSVIMSFLLGSLLGVLIGWWRGSILDAALSPILTFISAIPYFWLALILIYVLAFSLNLFPVSGGFDSSLTPGWNSDFILSVIQHAILPAITIIISTIAGWMLGMRNAMITTLSEDYVLMAQAKGLSERAVVFAYAARNAILPNITGFAIAIGSIVGGQLVTEIVFSYPGIGFALLQAIQNLDYAFIQGVFLAITVAVLGANFLTDLLYVALDPRVRQERS